jgi:hypothetical protein
MKMKNKIVEKLYEFQIRKKCKCANFHSEITKQLTALDFLSSSFFWGKIVPQVKIKDIERVYVFPENIL